MIWNCVIKSLFTPAFVNWHNISCLFLIAEIKRILRLEHIGDLQLIKATNTILDEQYKIKKKIFQRNNNTSCLRLTQLIPIQDSIAGPGETLTWWKSKDLKSWRHLLHINRSNPYSLSKYLNKISNQKCQTNGSHC